MPVMTSTPGRMWHGNSYKFVNPMGKKIRRVADNKIIFVNRALFSLQLCLYLVNDLYRDIRKRSNLSHREIRTLQKVFGNFPPFYHFYIFIDAHKIILILRYNLLFKGTIHFRVLKEDIVLQERHNRS